MAIDVIRVSYPQAIEVLTVTEPAIPGIVKIAVPGLQGPAGSGYIHTQGSASDTWTINHNLGFRPNVELFTAGGVEFEAEVIHTTLNQCIVYLATAIAGSARLV